MQATASLIECSRPSIPADGVALATCLALFVFIACCAAQDAPRTFPVDGVVENSLTHQPIARALVESAPDAVLTDSEGRFELHLPEGAAYLSARRPGYEGPESGRRPSQLRVNVSATTQPVTIFLTPAASITGHVTLTSGDQAAGLQFVLNRKQVEEGHARGVRSAIRSLITTAHSACLCLPRPLRMYCALRRHQIGMVPLRRGHQF